MAHNVKVLRGRPHKNGSHSSRHNRRPRHTHLVGTNLVICRENCNKFNIDTTEVEIESLLGHRVDDGLLTSIDELALDSSLFVILKSVFKLCSQRTYKRSLMLFRRQVQRELEQRQIEYQ